MPLDKKTLTVMLAEKVEVSQKLAKKAIDMLWDEIKKAVREDGEFFIHGLGKLMVREIRTRTGRNPNTGEPITIPKKKYIKFKPSERFLREVRG